MKSTKRSLFTFAVVVAVSLLSYGQGKIYSYMDGKDALSGYFAKAKSEKKSIPGIVVIPAWMGVNDHTKHSADELSALGYHALVADIYGEGKNPKSPAEAKELSSYYKNNPEVYQRRIKVAIEQLVKQGADAGNIVVIGYCFGGTGALEAARGGLPVKGVVSFHGGLGKDSARVNTPITAKVLVLHGADDPYVPQAQVTAFQNEMRSSKADWQMIYYANAVHAFTEPAAGNDNSKGTAYNEAAARRSWEHMELFLTDLFKK